MSDFRFVRRRIDQIKEEIGRVRTSDFHHPGVKLALRKIEDVFDTLVAELDILPQDIAEDVAKEYSSRINVDIERLHRFVGFILRSTHSRNSFEVYDPLSGIVKVLLDDESILVLSSEWEFSPFAEPSAHTSLSDCIFVGLPVMEATNALVVPLAGHEIGHSVWRAHGVGRSLEERMKAVLAEKFIETWTEFIGHFPDVSSQEEMRKRLTLDEWGDIPLEWIERQCEEIFCDMLGVRIFGMGYLYAFDYLCSPNVGPTDLDAYPAIDARAQYLAHAMEERCREDPWFATPEPERKEKHGLPDWPGRESYPKRFSEPERVSALALSNAELYLLRTSHAACSKLMPDLLACVKRICTDLPEPSMASALDILTSFRVGVPSKGYLGNVVNAGWLADLDEHLWRDREKWRQRKFEFINELVFKSLDVTEFEERTRLADASQIR